MRRDPERRLVGGLFEFRARQVSSTRTIEATQIPGLTSTQIDHLTTTSIDAMDATQINAFTTDQIALLATSRLVGISTDVTVQPVGSIPRSQGKAVRVRDLRKRYRDPSR